MLKMLFKQSYEKLCIWGMSFGSRSEKSQWKAPNLQGITSAGNQLLRFGSYKQPSDVLGAFTHLILFHAHKNCLHPTAEETGLDVLTKVTQWVPQGTDRVHSPDSLHSAFLHCSVPSSGASVIACDFLGCQPSEVRTRWSLHIPEIGIRKPPID